MSTQLPTSTCCCNYPIFQNLVWYDLLGDNGVELEVANVYIVRAIILELYWNHASRNILVLIGNNKYCEVIDPLRSKIIRISECSIVLHKWVKATDHKSTANSLGCQCPIYFLNGMIPQQLSFLICAMPLEFPNIITMVISTISTTCPFK